MDQKKISKKTMIGIGVCTAVLLGGVGYGTYSQLQARPTIEQQDPLNPIAPKENNRLSPRQTEQETDTSDSSIVRDERTTSSFADIRSGTGESFVQERANALTNLGRQIEEEQRRNTNPIQLINPTPPSGDTGNQAQSPERPQEPQLPELPEPEGPVAPPIPGPIDPIDPPVVVVDYSLLATLVQQAQEINLSLYLSASTEPFKFELQVAQRMLTEQISTQAAVNTQVARLSQSIDQLELRGDKTSLQHLYTQSQSIQTDIYTEESVRVLQSAQEEAKLILDHAEANQSMVDRVENQLKVAIDGLTEKEEPYLSLAYLKRLVAEAESLNMDEYTVETGQVLTELVEEITTYIESEEYTQEENERYIKALQQAIDQLEKKIDIPVSVNRDAQTMAEIISEIPTDESDQSEVNDQHSQLEESLIQEEELTQGITNE
ncbi:hypothetical protein [Enterococcus sp. 5H]|uniref:hypothetical protein n=1 Tax=Enterococcus sp. 5H TaxID=1229490 RepID=UPI0023029788|nr:hypothetical protein [Enterococcus sp. 5H]MDA9469896.1 hypothetical protein [Enterococcus sp. 5H]